MINVVRSSVPIGPLAFVSLAKRVIEAQRSFVKKRSDSEKVSATTVNFVHPSKASLAVYGSESSWVCSVRKCYEEVRHV